MVSGMRSVSRTRVLSGGKKRVENIFTRGDERELREKDESTYICPTSDVIMTSV
jgi:hypothetical protein